MISLETAKNNVKLATQLITKGQYNDALALVEQAAPAFEAAEDWEGYVQCLNKHSECLWRSGKHDAGIEKAETALQICLERLGENYVETANSYRNLGICYWSKGDYTQAIAYHQQALTIRLATIGEQHPHTAMSYNNFGSCYNDKGDYTQAIAYHQQALTIRLATIGEQHPNTAISYNNLN